MARTMQEQLQELLPEAREHILYAKRLARQKRNREYAQRAQIALWLALRYGEESSPRNGGTTAESEYEIKIWCQRNGIA